MRDSIHLTGTPVTIDATIATTYPGYTGTLLPKPPPMSPPTTRILLSAMPESIASTVRTRCGAWDVM